MGDVNVIRTGLIVPGDIILAGSLYQDGSLVSFNSAWNSVDSSIIPKTDAMYDLGAYLKSWNNIYINDSFKSSTGKDLIRFNDNRVVVSEEIQIGDKSSGASTDAAGMVKFDSLDSKFKGYNGSVWIDLDKQGTGVGTVTEVRAGDGMQFSTISQSGYVNLGTPSSITSDTSNGLSFSSHTHAIDYIDGGKITGTVPASNISNSVIVTSAESNSLYDIVWSSGDMLFNTINSRLQADGSTGSLISAGTMTASNFLLSSDIRLKENIKPINENYTNDIEAVEFNLVSNPDQKRYGVIAQELEELHPELVHTGLDGFKKVDYVDYLILRNDLLEKKINLLEKRILKLEII